MQKTSTWSKLSLDTNSHLKWYLTWKLKDLSLESAFKLEQPLIFTFFSNLSALTQTNLSLEVISHLKQPLT